MWLDREEGGKGLSHKPFEGLWEPWYNWEILKELDAKGSVQFSCLVVSNYLRPHGLQHTRLPCPSPSPGACSNSCPSVMPSNQFVLCHPLLLLPSIFPTSGSFLMRRLFESGDQSIGVSASASVLLMNIQDWFPLGWLVWSPCSPRDSQESSPTPQFKSISSLTFSLLYPSKILEGYYFIKLRGK